MFCEDLWIEILSKLPVKSLARLSCVSKYFQSLICFVNLQNSPKNNTHFLLSYVNQTQIFPSHISSWIEDPLPFFSTDNMPKRQSLKDQVLGSCNGLVCLLIWNNDESNTFHLYNPATKELFENQHCMLNPPEKHEVFMLGFGYDNLRDTYKVVAIIVGHPYSEEYPFRSLICSMDDRNGWREIQNFPVNPTKFEGDTIMKGVGIYLNNTLNWLGFEYVEDDDVDPTFNDVVIVSLDLVTETYTQLLLPRDLSKVVIYDFYTLTKKLHTNRSPLIGVLGGFLSLFLHNKTTNHLSIWQMKEFGNQSSWTRLLNTSFQDLGISTTRYKHRGLLPLCMVENDRDIIIIHCSYTNGLQVVVYNQSDKTVKSTMISCDIFWIYPFNYVESLISPIRLKFL